jgi:hypothetical protein
LLYKNNRKMRTVVAQIRAAWYGAEAGSVGVGGAGKPAKTGVNCEGLVNKAIAEAQRMVDEFKGNGVWGQLAPDEEADAWVPFGYSGMQVDDDADGWDDGVAVRLAKKDCEHVATIDLAVAQQLGVTNPSEAPRELKQHRKSPIKVIEMDDPGFRKLRWVDVEAIAEADLHQPSSELIDSTDHLSAAGIETPSVIEDAEAQTAGTNDEQAVHGEP